MRQLIRFIIRKFLSHTAGKAKFQGFYTVIHDIALRGMNYRSGDFRTSGEIIILRSVLKIFKENNNDVITIFDDGANVGSYSIELSKIFSDLDYNILAFEPSKTTFKTLKSNTEHIRNIGLYNFGFSASKKRTTLFSDQDNSGLASLYERDLNDIGIDMTAISEDVQLEVIDEFTTGNNIEKINFLKIDVEGHELDVLRGALNMISKGGIDIIQIEFGEPNIDSRHFLKDFYTVLSAYNFYRILKDGLTPLGNYSTTNEIFLTVNFIAIHKSISVHF